MLLGAPATPMADESLCSPTPPHLPETTTTLWATTTAPAAAIGDAPGRDENDAASSPSLGLAPECTAPAATWSTTPVTTSVPSGGH